MEAASQFRSTIEVSTADRVADGKSAISLMMPEAARGTELTICATGHDEVDAVNGLVQLVEQRFERAATLE